MRDFHHFERHKTAILTTYRKDGTPVSAPVSIAVEGDRAFFRTFANAGKVKRLRRNPGATIAPGNLIGKATGEPIRVRARLLSGDEDRHASRAVARSHRILQGVIVPMLHRLRRDRTLHYELTPEE